MLRFCLVLGVAALSATAGQAHYNMLLPESAMVKKGDKVVFVYQWASVRARTFRRSGA